MRTGRPKDPMILSQEEQEQLKGIASSRSLHSGLVTRARIVLMAAQGIPNTQISQGTALNPHAVGK